MKILKYFRSFNKMILNSKFKLIAISVICFIPMIYCSLFLSAFFDPYGKLNKLPIAIINLDEGYSNGSTVNNYGNKVIDRLKENKTIKWEFPSYNEGMNGLYDNKYYSAIIIPKDFSQKLSNVSKGNFSKPVLTYHCNEKKNFIAVQISNKIVDEIMKETNKSITKEGTETAVNGILAIKDGFKSAKDGSYEIYDGSSKLKDGSKKLSDGLNTASKGSILLSSGLKTASNGGAELSDGMNKLIDGLNEFNNALGKKDPRINQLSEGAQQLTQGIAQAKDGSIKLNNGLSKGLDEASKGVSKLSSAINEADSNLEASLTAVAESNMPDYQKQNIFYAAAIVKTLKNKDLEKTLGGPLNTAANSAAPLVDGLSKLENGANALSKGTVQLINGIEENQKKASTGISALIDGGEKIKSGLDNLSSGLVVASSKTEELSGGLSKLFAGSNTLYSGLEKLNDGSYKLYKGLSDGYETIDTKLNFNPKDVSEFISEPILLKSDRINPVDYYGEGFAPYFIPLGLWVGALVLCTILDSDIKYYENGFCHEQFFGKMISLSLLAVIQAVFLSLILIFVVNLKVKNLFLFFLFNIYLSIVIMIIFNSMIYLLGDLGRLLLFLALVIQLTTCGGTFPMELIPNFFRKLSPFFPMTYATNALRELVSGINYETLIFNSLILAAFMSGVTAISLMFKSFVFEKKTMILSKQ